MQSALWNGYGISQACRGPSPGGTCKLCMRRTVSPGQGSRVVPGKDSSETLEMATRKGKGKGKGNLRGVGGEEAVLGWDSRDEEQRPVEK